MSNRVPPKPGDWRAPAAVGLVAFLAVYGTLQVSAKILIGAWIPGWPHLVIINSLMGFVRKKEVWTQTHTLVAIGVFGVLLILTVIGVILFTPKPKSAAQRAAKHMSKGNEMSRKAVAVRTVAGRLTTSEVTGVLVAKTMKGLERLADWRSTLLIIMGPGAGKTTGESIPLIMDAPGVVFATTNKRDLPDAIRGAKDGPVYVFDPQQICSKDLPPWRLELSHYILRPGWDPRHADEVRAHKLAKIWMDSSGPVNAKRDAYFDSAGPNLLAGLLLATAISGAPMSQMYRWLMTPKNKQPVRILEEHGLILPALAMESVYDAPDEQRAGVFSTAGEMVSFLNNSRVRTWLESQGPDDDRPVFSPETFVRSGNETMIALSKEGIGTTGPLTAALTTWVLDAAEELADDFEHGRLPVPLVVVLDEAANVCRIMELPNLYSHYGSRGIFPVTILQTWAQGVRVWGEDGMTALWGASTIRIVGAGQADTKFLKMISDLTDQHYVKEFSSSSNKGGGSKNTSHALREILSVGELAALRPGEVWVHFSGGGPFVGRTIPWYERDEMKEKVALSIETYEPKNKPVTVP